MLECPLANRNSAIQPKCGVGETKGGISFTECVDNDSIIEFLQG